MNLIYRICAGGFALLAILSLCLALYTWVAKPTLNFKFNSTNDFQKLDNLKFELDYKDGGQIVFHNGPISNGTISSDGKGKDETWIGYGLYCRKMSVDYGNVKGSWWTLAINFWYPITIFFALACFFSLMTSSKHAGK